VTSGEDTSDEKKKGLERVATTVNLSASGMLIKTPDFDGRP